MRTTADVDQEVVTAVLDVCARRDAFDFQIGYTREDDDPEFPEKGPGWRASCLWRSARLVVQEALSPEAACDALARRLLSGGRCPHCRRPNRVSGSDRSGCVWRRVGPTWARGCGGED